MGTTNSSEHTEAIRVLLVEDEATYREVVAKRLRLAGDFAVTECDSGADALRLMEQQTFDVVVLDHYMPEMTGLNVLQRIHEQKWDIATIMFTGAGSENIATEAMKLGAYDYIPKHQMDPEHLPVIVRGVHERHLFKKEKEIRKAEEGDRAKQVATLERLRTAIDSFEHVANTTLSVMALALEECEEDLTPVLNDEGKKKLQKTTRLMRQDYQLLSLVVRSLMDVMLAMSGKFAEAPSSAIAQEELQGQLKAIQERIADETSKE